MSRPQPSGSRDDHDGRFEALQPSTLGRLRVIQIGQVELRLDSQTLRVAGQTTHLPTREFSVLQLLMDNAGRVVTRRELLDSCWGPGHPDLHKTLEVHINRLRGKLRQAGTPEHIRTVYGVGYIFDLPD